MALDFSDPFDPLTAPMKSFFGRLFLFFEFVPHITHLQIGASELKLCMLLGALDVPFEDLDF